ncbi:Sodium:dicarboxylate symporter family protein [Blastomyces dermatitidis ER-3]|uniref:Amino acid transporter n=1 Tax=Ajellomyces dermatitidis (strain ER-3 / ATCC MYA-2586) TaxID=559297 RepID=A0ABP2ES57_AJEDR|nr:Sodium:dicarboxylate symporter family protein [Blastomyces dermatitidis ER-3]EEQ85371.1 Sodium:dicarboxylate symporter family protein [Blastomyces dermatitidis ER-3]
MSSNELRETGSTEKNEPLNLKQVQSPGVVETMETVEEPKKTLWEKVKTPGSVYQILISAVIAIAIGFAVNTTVEKVPVAAVDLCSIPGKVWLRALKMIVLPLIVVSLILAVQRLREMSRGGALLARWTIGYYLFTTLVAILHSTILVSLVWAKQFTEVDPETRAIDKDLQKDIDSRSVYKAHDIVVELFETLVPDNIVAAFANDILLGVLVVSIILGYMIRDPATSSILKVVREIEGLITVAITFLINMAPIGIFFLIMPNLFKLDIKEVGINLGLLIGAGLSGMAIQLFIIYPILYFAVMRQNPFAYWMKNSPAWVTAWGTASSAGTMPVTLKCLAARKVPDTIAKFAIPLGTLVNMDGTAIYLPITVTFLAATQGQVISAGQYVVVFLTATLASIGTTPIPSSSLVLIIMIANSISVEVTGMYGVITAIDWFMDRFRTMTNVTGDLYGGAIVAKITGIRDPIVDADGTIIDSSAQDENAKRNSQV